MAKAGVMNFFEHQDQARRKTGRLIFLFGVAVALIIVALYFSLQLILMFALFDTDMVMPTQKPAFQWWDTMTFLAVAGIVSLFIFGASFYKTMQLKDGGSSVATMLGGKRVPRSTKDPDEKRLYNIVEEMAIASGVPVPQVFVLDQESGINAFAAGFSISDAAVAVTRGTLATLNRDELQGVIAHEFSHIFNGDMRLNIRLMGVLYGILAIGVIGHTVMRVTGVSSRRSRGKGAGGIVLAGLALMVIGYIGTFIGRAIKAAVSRQREFLADASAVQFTRNPDGISGALKKIGGYSFGSGLLTPKAEEVSHFFFSRGTTMTLFSSFMATHPALEQRIARIDPSFNGKFPKVDAPKAFLKSAKEQRFQFAKTALALQGIPIGRIMSEKTMVAPKPGGVVDMVGNPSAGHLSFSASLIELIPNKIKEAVATPTDAMYVIYALLLDRDSEERDKQIGLLRRGLAEKELQEIQNLFSGIKEMDLRARLPLADFAAPALRELPRQETADFVKNIEALVISDKVVTLFEFCLHWLVNHRLKVRGKPPKVAYHYFPPLVKDMEALLGLLAKRGNPSKPDDAAKAFTAGADRIPEMEGGRSSYDPEQKPALKELNRHLQRLSLASFGLKRKIIDASAHCAFADRDITISEGELLRVISAALDCPLPPFLPEIIAA
jgi:Zn-dependent protease with chaperone function